MSIFWHKKKQTEKINRKIVTLKTQVFPVAELTAGTI